MAHVSASCKQEADQECEKYSQLVQQLEARLHEVTVESQRLLEEKEHSQKEREEARTLQDLQQAKDTMQKENDLRQQA